jgi:hypothetical protein
MDEQKTDGWQKTDEVRQRPDRFDLASTKISACLGLKNTEISAVIFDPHGQ